MVKNGSDEKLAHALVMLVIFLLEELRKHLFNRGSRGPSRGHREPVLVSSRLTEPAA